MIFKNIAQNIDIVCKIFYNNKANATECVRTAQ